MNNRQRDNRKALVLFSGGQDSATCLVWALDHYREVETIGFDYGQRHSVELECRAPLLDKLRQTSTDWANRIGQDHLLDFSLLSQISDTALTDNREIQMNQSGLPNTFVPGRNLLFFTLASALAYRRGLSVLVGGMCETDYSGYPDCRDNTLKSLQVSLSLGMDTPMTIETPLMWLSKAQTWRMALELGGQPLVEIITEHSHTCYLGDRTKRHAWGYGCGTCPACELRATGHAAYLAGSN